MRVEVLGTVRVAGADGAVGGAALGGRRAHVVLTALGLQRGGVTAERLAAMVWPEVLPGTWSVALRGIVRGLRQAMAPIGGGGQQVIVTGSSAYRLAVGVEVDVEQYAVAVRDAAALHAEGRHRAALELARPVSRLSGDQLLPDDEGGWLRSHRDGIDALARSALDILVRAAGDLGEHPVAVAAARQLVATQPLDEHAHRTLIGALDLAGDRAGAVRAYEDCRALLAEQLGVDPSAQTIDAYLVALRDQRPSTSARPPAESSSFIGREAELAALRTAVERPGLLTVSGPGGVGKSRLAARVAAAAADAFPGGRFWVPLGALSEDALVAATVGLRLGVPCGTGDPTATIAEHLAPLGRTLLVLDGCEAVRDGAASLASALLGRCPSLTVVTTSRLALHVDGELLHRVEPLPPPATDRLAGLPDEPAVRLLLDRVGEGGGHLGLDAASAPSVVALLRRCAGLPLAVELVAAQLVTTAAGDLLDQLPEAAGDPLRGIVRASYQLLDEREAAVFRRFAVLDGSVGLSLVRQVVADDVVPALRVVRILRELTAIGLVGVQREGPRWRYRQDDDLRRFAHELLVEQGEERAAFQRLAQAVRAVLPGDAREPPGPYQATVNDLLGSVHSLFGAGLAGRADGAACLELAFRLHRYWAATNVAEGRFWLSRLLARHPDTAWSLYARYALGYLDYWSGDTVRAVAELAAVVDGFADRPDPYAARALIYLAGLLDDVDRGAEAVDYVRRSIRAAQPFGIDLQVSAAMGLGSVLSERGDPDAAKYAAQAIDLCHSGGSREQLAAALPTAAMICWQVGDLTQARAFVEAARPLHAGVKRIARVVLLSASAGIALAEGDVAAAVDFGTAADAEGTELGVEREMPLIRAVLSRALLASGDTAGAAERAAASLQAALGMSYTSSLAVGLEAACLVLRTCTPEHAGIGRLAAAAAVSRAKGNRPAPQPLGGLGGLGDPVADPDGGPVLDPRAAGRLALDLLAAL